ncbi:MAG: hypothetical protein PHS48_01865 [Bacteroidales bacterium]|nr:hypothetical protein [Bacteroidales bacterium]
MASIRNLKKSIKTLTQELIEECIAFSYFHQDVKTEYLSEILESVTEAHNELLSRINSGIYDKNSKAARAHFRAIIQDARKMPDLLKFEE